MNVIITGGGSGLGRSLVERFALDAHNRVLFTYCQTPEAGLVEAINNANVTALRCDFSSVDDFSSLLTQADAFEAELLINNSWPGLDRKHFHRFEREEIDQSFDRNVASTVALSRHLLKAFKKRRAGKIINILTSALINRPPVGMSIYAAEKAYLLQLSKSWIAEFGSFGVAVNNVLPGFMATGMNASLDERVVEMIRDSSPNRELLTTGELAEAVYLLANMPPQVTGNNLVVNGGENLDI